MGILRLRCGSRTASPNIPASGWSRRFLPGKGKSIVCSGGIGLPADSADAKAPVKWQGQNLLGFALMEVRDELRRAAGNEQLCD